MKRDRINDQQASEAATAVEHLNSYFVLFIIHYFVIKQKLNENNEHKKRFFLTAYTGEKFTLKIRFLE